MEDKDWRYARAARFAYVGTCASDGPHVRAMCILSANDKIRDGKIWFLTYKDSGKVKQISGNPKTCLYMWVHECPSQNLHTAQLRVDGLAEIVNDASIKRKLWNEGLRRFIPDGTDDDQVVCIAVTPEKVEFTDPAILSLRPKL